MRSELFQTRLDGQKHLSRAFARLRRRMYVALQSSSDLDQQAQLLHRMCPKGRQSVARMQHYPLQVQVFPVPGRWHALLTITQYPIFPLGLESTSASEGAILTITLVHPVRITMKDKRTSPELT